MQYMKKEKIICVWILVGCLLTMFSACVSNPQELVTKDTIYMATVDQNSKYRNSVFSFNKENDEKQIEIKNYSDDFNTRMTQIEASIISKDAPDIIEVPASFSNEYLQNYINKQYLEDIAYHLEQSEKVNKSDYLKRVVEDFTVEGKIYGLPNTFSLQTLACDTGACKGKTQWTVDEFLEFMEENPNAMCDVNKDILNTRENVLDVVMYCGIYNFVDYENGVASFNTPEFQMILQRIHDLPMTTVDTDKTTRSQAGEKVLWTVQLSSVRDFQQAEWKNAQGKELTMIGYPVDKHGKSSGAIISYSSFLSVNINSAHKEDGWNFIERIMAGSKSVPDIYFPTGKEALEEKLMEDTEVVYLTDDSGEYERDENGEKIEAVNTFNGIPYPAITLSQVDKVRKAIEGAIFWKHDERAMRRIILEETEPYFSGEKTLQEVVDIIQKRIQLSLDERR